MDPNRNLSPKLVGRFDAIDSLAPDAGSVAKIEIGPDGTTATFSGKNPSTDAGSTTLTGLKGANVVIAKSDPDPEAPNIFGTSGAGDPTSQEILDHPGDLGGTLFSIPLTDADAGQPYAITVTGLEPGAKYDYVVIWND